MLRPPRPPFLGLSFDLFLEVSVWTLLEGTHSDPPKTGLGTILSDFGDHCGIKNRTRNTSDNHANLKDAEKQHLDKV